MYDKELQEILDKIKKYAPNADVTPVIKAYELAKSAHAGVFRKSGEPYIIHPIAVANILADLELDMEVIAAGLLHDVVEDTPYTYEDIKELFGKDIADLVDGVTKLGKIKYQTKEESQAENLRKMFLAMAKDIRVILIKLADRLHNMRTLKYMPEEKAKYKAKETLEIYGGIAHRIGISKIKWELEDLALKYIDPEGYRELAEKITMKRSQRQEYIDKIVRFLQDKFKEVDIDCEVSGRPKHFYSIYKKMRKKHKTFEEIYDLTAVRIIVNTVKDCYAVLGMVHTMWIPMPGRFKDYIAMPKPNLYQSLHTTVIGPDGEPVEIQIRTHEMHEIAENGIAAHWKYKEGITGSHDAKMEQKLKWLRQMMEWEKDVQDPHEFLDALKDDVFNSQVYVFTPRGDVIELPAGSTPIDFAYRVHTNVGNKCTGAKINGKIVPINYKLQNGEIVEVITSANSPGPSRDWLSIVQTPTARNRIRQWFKKERREENIQRGTEILEKEFKKYHIPLKDSNIEKYMQQMTKKFNQPTVEDLIATIGYGGIMPAHVVPKIRDLYEKEVKKVQKEQKEEINDIEKHSISDAEYKQKRKKNNSQGIVVKRLDNILIRFAKCCNPLPGDEIIGYVTKGRGVAIHRADCPNANVNGDFFKNRLVDVAWSNSEASKFEAEIQIKAVDRRGIINDITHIIAMDKVSLNGISAKKGKDNVVSVNLLVEVNNIDALNTLMKKIKSIPGVENIYRVIN